MGRREYGIKINSIKDAKTILNIIKTHNEASDSDDHDEFTVSSRGEFLLITGYLNFKNNCWIVLTNYGGENYTCKWFDDHFSNIEWYYGSLNLPDGWFECNNFIWKNNENEQTYELPSIVVDFIKKNQ